MLNGVPMTPTAANVKYANRLAIEIRDKIAHDTFSLAEYFPTSGAGGALTVGSQLDTWLAAQRIEASTRAGYESAVRFWKITGLGDKVLRTLRTSHAMTALATRADLSGKTVNNYISVLREAIELAVTDKLLTENPIEKVPRAKHQKEPADPFTRHEVDRIIDHMATKYPGQSANLVEFWMWTGLRTSEVFGLRWDNVDLSSGTMLITEAKVRGIQKSNTKTNVARTVRLNSRAVAAVQRQRAHTQMAGNAVFHDPRYAADWSDERAFRRSYWTPTLKVLGIRYRRPYNMRHTYATLMLMAGMNPSMCAKQLGHSVEMFLKTYTKWIDGDQNDREMDKLESTINNNSSLQLPRQIKTAT
jgi:integrase